MPRRKLVVIGNGMSGVRAVEEILALGGVDSFDISIFGEESCGHYDRSQLPQLLAGECHERDLYRRPLSWYADQGVSLQCGSRVTEIDRASHVVYARNGARAGYDMLLLATGARSQMPPLTGIYDSSGRLRPDVFGFRTLDDCRRIAAFTTAHRTVVVLGGGYDALEAACALRKRGCIVHLVHRGSQLMPVGDSVRGARLHAQLQALGVHVHLERTATDLLATRHVCGIAFSDGGSLACDLLVVLDKFAPDVEIGIRAGLAVENAIVVDAHMRSVDDHDVYAIGECAQHRGKVSETIAQLGEQAAVFARHITARGRSMASRAALIATQTRLAGNATSLR
jgi:nitrite reductase (NADH) large subunit